MAKLNAAGGIKANAIGERNLRRNFPKTGGNRLVAWSLCYHVKRVARRNPHTAFSVKNDVYHKRFVAEVAVNNIIHARSLHLLLSRGPLPTEAFGAWPGLATTAALDAPATNPALRHSLPAPGLALNVQRHRAGEGAGVGVAGGGEERG